MNQPPAEAAIPEFRDYAEFAARVRYRLRPESDGRPAAQPLVSVITVCKNAAVTLPRCLASVRAQSYRWIEHIVIDGGSTDGTQAFLEAEVCLSGWVSEADAGISDAFNKGLSLCRGTIIGILNADDEYLPDTVAQALAGFQAEPEAGFIFGDCDFTIGGKVVLHRDGDPAYARVIDREMPVLNHPTVLVRREIYARHGLFRTDLALAMDYDLLLRFHRAGVRGIRIPQTLARMALGGITSRRILKAYDEATRIAIAHGRPRGLALLTLCRAVFIPLLRAGATAIGLRRLWLAIRQRV